MTRVYDFRGRELDYQTGTLLSGGEEQAGIFSTRRTNESRQDAFDNKFMRDFMHGLNGPCTHEHHNEQNKQSGEGGEDVVKQQPQPQVQALIRRKGNDSSSEDEEEMFSGKTVFFSITPHPDDEFRPPPTPPPEFSKNGVVNETTGFYYYTKCRYCCSIVKETQRERGFRLSEIVQAADEGCGTCDVLQKVVKSYADIIFDKYDPVMVMIRQSHNRPSLMLSRTKQVTVVFDDHGGEWIVLNFDGASEYAGSGRKITNTSSFAAVSLIKNWLDTCSEEHAECAIPTMSALPMRVLDVSNSRVKLVETNGERGSYVTLSHCWGLKTITKTTTTNLEEMKKDISWSSLSKTFQDAVNLTWRLGFRYLWIDGLCILQDSQEDWELHAAQMAKIFSNSQLTISAARGADGQKGLFSNQMKEPLTLLYCDSRKVCDDTLWHDRNIDGPDRDGERKDYVIRLERSHGLYRHKRPKEPLLKRAWVFQEQILSPRIIHFASGELYFECRSHIVCECSDWSLRSNSSSWETRWRKAHSWLIDQGGKKRKRPATIKSQQKTRRRDYEAYRTLVERYSELEITAESDKLPALSGVTFGRKDEYLAGMWRSILLESLHWNPGAVTLNNVMARRPTEYRGPSWSWVSMEAPIRHFATDFFSARGAKPVATIIGASCTVEGLDPRGRVSGGYLRIRGPMDEIKVTEIGFCPQELEMTESFRKITLDVRPTLRDPTLDPPIEFDEFVTYATLKKDNVEGRAFLDVPLALCRLEPAEVTIGQYVTGLVISSGTVLLLKKVPNTPGAYRRVGYFKPKKEGWSFMNTSESIFIL